MRGHVLIEVVLRTVAHSHRSRRRSRRSEGEEGFQVVLQICNEEGIERCDQTLRKSTIHVSMEDGQSKWMILPVRVG